MLAAFNKVLFKIFVKGFYQAHASVLLFFFVSIITYCFFIQVLNETHLAPAERVMQNLLFVLTLLTSPPLVVVVFVVWLVFTIKSWSYVARELAIQSNQFLFYSITALSNVELFTGWFLTQCIISLPLIVFGAFALVVGAIYHHYIIPILIFSYLLLLSLVSAVVYTVRVKKISFVNHETALFKIARNLRKPFFSLFLFKIAHELPLTFIITKLVSSSIIIGCTYLFADIHDTFKIGGMIALGIATAHSLLVFESYRFEIDQLSFVRNFPCSRGKIYIQWLATFFILMLPESTWLLILFKGVEGFLLPLFCVGVAMLLRSVLYKSHLKMKVYLQWTFYLFASLFLLILFGLLWILIPFTLAISWSMFYTSYRKYT
jgi:hypothetical protein